MECKCKVSFVIPVYNVADYIQDCISSIISLNNFSYEILVINDGSVDDSILIVNREFNLINNLRIIHQSNAGLSAARNTGINNAQGEYICFIDGDDFIDADNLEKIISLISGEEDIIIANFYNQLPKGCFVNKCRITNGYVNSGRYFLRKYYLKDIYTVVWRNIYKTSFIKEKELFFYNGVTYEDVEWTPRVLFNANIVKYIDLPFYFYRKRNNSIVNSQFSEKKFDDILLVASSLFHFSVNIDNEDKIVIHRSASFFILLALSCLESMGRLTFIRKRNALDLLYLMEYNSLLMRLLIVISKKIPSLFFCILKFKFGR